jgi:hypothetical protein
MINEDKEMVKKIVKQGGVKGTYNYCVRRTYTKVDTSSGVEETSKIDLHVVGYFIAEDFSILRIENEEILLKSDYFFEDLPTEKLEKLNQDLYEINGRIFIHGLNENYQKCIIFKGMETDTYILYNLEPIKEGIDVIWDISKEILDKYWGQSMWEVVLRDDK